MNEAEWIIRQAKEEIEQERYRAAVDAAKVKMRARRWWHLPFTITIKWRES